MASAPLFRVYFSAAGRRSLYRGEVGRFCTPCRGVFIATLPGAADTARPAWNAARYNCVMTRSYSDAAAPQPSVSAALLQLARLKAHLSQRQLAERVGVPATMISAYERDRRQPTMATLQRLLKGAGFDLRLQLAPADSHDEVLAALEEARSPGERGRRDRQIEAWRHAKPVG